MIGGYTLIHLLGQRSLLFALAQLEVEELAVLLNVVQPFWFQVTERKQRI